MPIPYDPQCILKTYKVFLQELIILVKVTSFIFEKFNKSNYCNLGNTIKLSYRDFGVIFTKFVVKVSDLI